MIQQLNLSDRVISYDLQIKNVKNINMRIKSDGSIFVSANKSVSLKRINDFLLSKEAFIIDAQSRCEVAKANAPKPKRYVSGDMFVVLGRELKLNVINADDNHIECDDTYINLYTKDGKAEKILKDWLHKSCEDIVIELCRSMHKRFEEYGFDFPQIRFRTMTSRWGSCHTQKKILTFNYKLIAMPIEAIEGVVAHEFVHFLVPNHSTKFYDILELYTPDWMHRRELLKEYSRRYYI